MTTCLAGLLLCVAAPAGAAIDSPTHLYAMDEQAGAMVMADVGTVPVPGEIGEEVETGVVFDGATGYRFDRLPPNQPPAHPEHNVTISDHSSLDPYTGTYTIEIRYRTTNSFGNLIQKGQSTTRGGQFKIQMPQGRPTCYFKDDQGRRVGTGAPAPLNDGAWHTLRCTRTASAVELFVDGVRVGRKNGITGRIANASPVSIGGKTNCDQVEVTCDYFGGDVDYVILDKS